MSEPSDRDWDNRDDGATGDRLTVARGGTDTPVAVGGDGRLTAPPGYELLGEAGRGGMGLVYRARDLDLDREVAVKVLQDRFAPDSPAARRFVDEAHITARLQHPGIPPVYRVGTLPDGRPFLAMKLIKGRTLEDLLRAGAPVDVLAVFEGVAQAVGYAHACGVIHRDLKPANVMVGAFGEVQVMDWGLAKVLGRGPGAAPAGEGGGTEVRTPRDSDGEFTQAGSVLGTPAFMAPEQAAGAVDRVDARSDVFGLGGVLCVLLTGRPPFVGSSAETARVKAARGDLADCRARLDACGAEPGLVALCEHCLDPDPADRPADGGAVAAAAAALRQEAEERARRAELERVKAEGEKAAAQLRAAELRQRWRFRLTLAAAAAVLLLGGGLFAWHSDRQAAAGRGRRERTADSVTALLGEAEGALQARDAARAGVALEAARRRSGEGGAEDLGGRLAGLSTDLALLRGLNDVDQFRWTPTGRQFPDPQQVSARYRAALAGFNIDPEADPRGAAAEVTGSAVREQLVAALDRVLWAEQSARVRAALRAADPDPFRDAVRDAVTAKDRAKLAELAGQEGAAGQPPGFVAALGENAAVPVDLRRSLLRAAVLRRPGELGLLMAQGNTYPLNQREGADERVRWFQAAVAVAPTNPATHFSLGAALHDQGDTDGAVAQYREAVRLDPKLAPARNNLGVALKQQGDTDGALEQYQEALRLDPEFALAHDNVGLIRQQRGDFDGAVAAHREAVRFAPEDPLAHNNLGAALERKGDIDGALEQYQEALRLDPKLALAHDNVGQIRQRKGDYDGAVAAHREAVRLDPKFAQAHDNLGWALQQKGDFDGAIPEHEEAIRLNPKLALAHNNLGVALAGKGDLDGALARYREAVRLGPKLAQAHYNLGNSLAGKGDFDAAVACLREAVRLDPNFALGHNNLGWALQQKGDLDAAVARYEEAIRLDPKLSLARANLAGAERMRKLLPRLPAILDGTTRPETAAEACRFAELCAQPFQNKYTAAVRLYEQAFDTAPELAGDLTAAHRYNAACFAIRAASGDGADAPAKAEDRAALRAGALGWLKDDLASWQKRAPKAEEPKAADVLSWWLRDPDLAGVREADRLAELPADERRRWESLWADVRAAVEQARGAPAPLNSDDK